MRAELFRGVTVPGLLVTAILLAVAYRYADQLIGVSMSRAVLLGAIAYSMLVFANPRLGLYTLGVSLLLIPTKFHVSATSLLSPNLVIMAAALWAWGMSIVQGNLVIRSTGLYVPLAILSAVTWIGFVRYGSQFFNFPLIFSESVVLFVLTLHLLKEREHVRRLLMVLVVAFIVRNSIDVIQTLISLSSGPTLGPIRGDRLLFGGTATTESHLRALVLPLMIMGFAYAPDRRSRILIGVSLAFDVAWLGLAGTRTGAIALVTAPLATIALMPRSKQSRAALMAVPLIVLVILLATQISGMGSHVLARTQRDLDAGFEGGRPAVWREAFYAFTASPLVGSGLGASHSYILGAARTMGLAFLLPLFAAMLIIWSHCAWLRKIRYDQESYAIAGGVMATLIVVFFLNSTGTMLRGYPSFVFWIIIGVAESVYLDVRAKRALAARASEPQPESLPGGVRAELSG